MAKFGCASTRRSRMRLSKSRIAVLALRPNIGRASLNDFIEQTNRARVQRVEQGLACPSRNGLSWRMAEQSQFNLNRDLDQSLKFVYRNMFRPWQCAENRVPYFVQRWYAVSASLHSLAAWFSCRDGAAAGHAESTRSSGSGTGYKRSRNRWRASDPGYPGGQGRDERNHWRLGRFPLSKGQCRKLYDRRNPNGISGG